jgi:hypothetical protein
LVNFSKPYLLFANFAMPVKLKMFVKIQIATNLKMSILLTTPNESVESSG